MVFPVVLVKLVEQILYLLLPNSCHIAARKVRNYGFLFKNPLTLSVPSSPSTQQHQQNPFSPPYIPKYSHLQKRRSDTGSLVCDIDEVLLRPSSTCNSFFPYFMLVAFEAGSIVRSFFLLLSCSFLWVLDYHQKMTVMIFITFCGLKVKDMEIASRGILPKFYLENINLEAYEVLVSAGSRVVFTSVPRAMVGWFLQEYLGVDDVVGTELHVVGGYYSGLVSGSGLVVKHRAVREFFGEKKPDVGIGSGSSLNDHLFISMCKEDYVLNKEDMKNPSSVILPRERYPKPLIFHDGRLAFLPTPLATFSMFMWLPLGITLAICRIFIGIFLPYKLAICLGSCSGMRLTLKRQNYPTPPSKSRLKQPKKNNGFLYVCNHRTLLDPVYLSTALGKPLTAVTYSLSKVSELIAPIKTVRLRRDKAQDGETMQRLLREGDLVVCPEGTTCREPYLLRFSSLFAELAEEIVPVAMTTSVSMFHGTTASGFKWLDPVMFMMNPKPVYSVEVLGKLPKELTCSGGRSGLEVANYIQKQLGAALGFECTRLTRKDKYLMLAGNEGIVHDHKSSHKN